jgi:predicted DNA-binding antitoxin AbrB/MazE fold protein
MRAYKIETTIPENGVLTLDSLPFRAGEAVEVIILSREAQQRETVRGSLRGKVLHYEHPMKPVAEEDWDALR